MSPDEIASLFGAKLAKEDVLRAVHRAASSERCGPPPWTIEAALALLERIAREAGAIGIGARFAKAKLLLKTT